jgi:hypothetical protein
MIVAMIRAPSFLGLTSRQIRSGPNSHLGRFNSLTADFVSLLVRFISLFGRVGNSPCGLVH